MTHYALKVLTLLGDLLTARKDIQVVLPSLPRCGPKTHTQVWRFLRNFLALAIVLYSADSWAIFYSQYRSQPFIQYSRGFLYSLHQLCGAGIVLRQGNQGSRKLRNGPQTTQLINSKAKMWPPISPAPNTCSWLGCQSVSRRVWEALNHPALSKSHCAPETRQHLLEVGEKKKRKK